MVARINTGKSISKALNYNEQKVKQGSAEILGESGFLKDAVHLSFYDKMDHFKRFTSLNERTTTNTLHVSLNFDPSEKIGNDKMVEIADAYMNKIGFGGQPYLVYRHYDSAHPHIHIVSTNIQADGKRISMHNLGRNQSELARREIEVGFGLVKADEKKNADPMKIMPLDLRKIVYGKSETRRAIASVLGPVINQYKFSSLAELNAVLGLYNITADRGREGSRIFCHNGLTYSILDEKGQKAGIPLKASAFFMKPTLANLEVKFAANEALKTPHKKKIQTAIGWVLNKPLANIETFISLLQKENITVVLRKGKADNIYGITYVDHKTKCVFNGSDLGKLYSAKSVLEQCGHPKTEAIIGPVNMERGNKTGYRKSAASIEHKTGTASPQKTPAEPLIAGDLLSDALLTPVPGRDYIPYQFKKRKKRKKKKIAVHQ